MTNVALLGCAHIHTPGFVKRLNERTDVAVKAVWDRDSALASSTASQLNAPVVADLQAVLSDPDIQAVVVCSQTDRHESLVTLAAQAGKHLFVEKPLGLGAADAYAMARAIDQAGVLFQTGYFMRGMPVHLFIRDQIAKGHFGKITRVRHSNCHAGSLKGWFDTDYRWMADPAIAGCGAFGDLGTHVLDILLWLMGDAQAVTAQVDVTTGRYGDCDECGEGLIRFANGVIGSLAAGWVDVADPVRLIVSGTQGHACVVNNQLYFTSEHVDGADGQQPWTDLPDAWPHAFELFLDAVTGQPNVPLVTATEAAARSAVMEAFYEAARTQAWLAPTTG